MPEWRSTIHLQEDYLPLLFKDINFRRQGKLVVHSFYSQPLSSTLIPYPLVEKTCYFTLAKSFTAFSQTKYTQTNYNAYDSTNPDPTPFKD